MWPTFAASAKKDEQGQKTHPARRWVVERTFSWLSRWRGLLIRWEKKPENYLAHMKMACALLWFRRAYQAGLILLGQTVSNCQFFSMENGEKRTHACLLQSNPYSVS